MEDESKPKSGYYKAKVHSVSPIIQPREGTKAKPYVNLTLGLLPHEKNQTPKTLKVSSTFFKSLDQINDKSVIEFPAYAVNVNLKQEGDKEPKAWSYLQAAGALKLLDLQQWIEVKGYVANEPVIRNIDENHKKAIFSIGVNSSPNAAPVYHNIEVSDKFIDSVSSLKVGDQVKVEGYNHVDTYINKDNKTVDREYIQAGTDVKVIETAIDRAKRKESQQAANVAQSTEPAKKETKKAQSTAADTAQPKAEKKTAAKGKSKTKKKDIKPGI